MRGAPIALAAVTAFALATLGCSWIDPEVGPLRSDAAIDGPDDHDAQTIEAGSDAGFDGSVTEGD